MAHEPTRTTPHPSQFELLTSPGPAAIAVIRVSGPRTPEFLHQRVRTRPADRLPTAAPGHVVRAALLDATGATLDDILISVHAQPPTWDLRLHLHGSPALVRACTDWLAECGFTLRPAGETPLWIGEDAIATESYALLPRMPSLRGARWLLKQTDRLRETVTDLLNAEWTEHTRATCRELAARQSMVEWFTQAARLALVGPPNAGKSSLANALADQAISLISPVPGTTRDWVDVPSLLSGFPVVWFDTAGLRRGAEALEAAGIARTRAVMAAADAIVVVLDANEVAAASTFIAAHGDLTPACVALNKSDLPDATLADEVLPPSWRPLATNVSALERTGLEALGERVLAALGRDLRVLDRPGAITTRQTRLLLDAASSADERSYRTALRIIRDGSPAD